MLEVRRSRDRGYSDNGWLKTFHSFAFADYFDPEHVEFGPLRVVNEDRIKPGKGFGPHSPQEMEILTFVVQGEIERKNSLGQTTVLRAGDIQRLSAGTGLQHSEANLSATHEAYLLQVWVHPAKQGLAPSVETRHFGPDEKLGRLKLVASPSGELGSLKIQQDARVYAAILNDPRHLHFEVGRGRCAYIHVARGSVAVGETRLNSGDAMKITHAPRIILHSGNGAELILLNLPSNRLNAVFQRPRVHHVRPTPAAPPAETADPVLRQDHFAMFGPRGLGFALARLPRGFALVGQSSAQAAQSTTPQPRSAARPVKERAAASSAGSGRRAARRKATSGR
jgi:redox-sensitive bicupin YhaK (pirin superfamily)